MESNATPNSDSIHLELYVRTLSPPGARTRQEEIIDRLRRLEEDDDIAGFSVQVWGRQIDPTTSAAETEQGEFILNRIAEFQQWALANNTTLESFYQTRQRSSSITGEEYTTIVLPKMGLAEYHGSELERVTPCTGTRDEVETVVDHLEEIERRATAQRLEQPVPGVPIAEE